MKQVSKIFHNFSLYFEDQLILNPTIIINISILKSTYNSGISFMCIVQATDTAHFKVSQHILMFYFYFVCRKGIRGIVNLQHLLGGRMSMNSGCHSQNFKSKSAQSVFPSVKQANASVKTNRWKEEVLERRHEMQRKMRINHFGRKGTLVDWLGIWLCSRVIG